MLAKVIVFFISLFALFRTTPANYKLSKQELLFILDNRAGHQLSNAQMLAIADSIHKYSKIFDVEPSLILSIIETESSYDPTAPGRDGERGLMQIMEIALSEVNRVKGWSYGPSDLWDISTNIKCGVAYFSICFSRAKGVYSHIGPNLTTIQRALMFYNDGWRMREKGLAYMYKVLDVKRNSIEPLIR